MHDYELPPTETAFDTDWQRLDEVVNRWRHSRDPATHMVSKNYKEEQASLLRALVARSGYQLAEIVPDESERLRVIRDADAYDGKDSHSFTEAA